MWSCFLRVRPLSTCSKVTPIAAINFAVWFTLCRNENDQIWRIFFTEEKAAGGHATRHRFRCRFRRFIGTEHETLAGALNRTVAARRCRRRHHRVQCDQKPAGRNRCRQSKSCDQDGDQPRGGKSHATVAGKTGKKSEGKRSDP